MMNLKSLFAGLALGIAVACNGVGAQSASQVEDPFADATVWFKGFTDVNGDGVLQEDDLRSAVATPTPWTSTGLGNAPVITNELVALPYRGGRRWLPTLYFPQSVTITNEEAGTGYGRISTAMLNGFTTKAGVTTNNYTVAIRFRPDNEQFRSDYSWIFNWGYANQASGWNLGLYRFGYQNDRIFKDGAKTNTVSYRTYTPTFFKNGQAANLFSNAGGIVYGNRWHDLIITVDGDHRKLRYVLCREPWDDAIMTPNMASDAGGQMTYSNEVEMTVGVGTNFTPSANFLLGSEDSASGQIAYYDAGKVTGNSTKSYRGSIHQLAVWNRAMSFEEMKRTLAYPRGDVLRVGVQDGTANEFRGGSQYGDDDREWTLPTVYAAGTSATMTFNADRKGEGEMPQILRWWGAADSATGEISLSINGKDLGRHLVGPGRKTAWLVKPNVLVDGTNTMSVTRVDDGASPVKLDALAIGGSWQIGHKDGRYTEFAHEGSGLVSHEILDGNTFSIRRVLFGSVPGGDTPNSYTNMVYTFTVPKEFRGGHYAWTLEWKDLANNANHYPRWRLNGQDLGYTARSDAQYHTIDIPDELLGEEVNELELYNAGIFVKGSYYSLDYFRMTISMRNGTFLILR